MCWRPDSNPPPDGARLGCALVGLVLGGLVGAALGWLGAMLAWGREGLHTDVGFVYPVLAAVGAVVGSACGARFAQRQFE